jgi:leucyl-tRNA synthetase
MGLVEQDEPFKKLICQGMILGKGGEKMSKSLGNVVNPDEFVEIYGADSLRLYEVFLGPIEQTTSFNADGVRGMRK